MSKYFPLEKYFSLFKGSSKDLYLVAIFFQDSLKVICFAMKVNYVILSTAVAPLNIMSSIFLRCGKVSVQKAIFLILILTPSWEQFALCFFFSTTDIIHQKIKASWYYPSIFSQIPNIVEVVFKI